MVSKSRIKLIKSLSRKKFRDMHGLFVVEGKKGVQEFLKSDFFVESVYVTEDHSVDFPDSEIISEKDMMAMSNLQSAPGILAVVKQLNIEEYHAEGLALALDGLRDPGNMGTIIRLCDWFGIKNILCSFDTVDCYNPKVVQASMGSLTRVNISYANLEEILTKEANSVFGTFMNGENIYAENLPEKGIIVLGNEANGISESIEKLIQKRISIPQMTESGETESLNVSTAAAIILSEFRRKSLTGKQN